MLANVSNEEMHGGSTSSEYLPIDRRKWMEYASVSWMYNTKILEVTTIEPV